MSDHAAPVGNRVDLGNQVFIAAVFLPLAIVVVASCIGFGVTGSKWVAVLGIAIVVLFGSLANRLYSGNKPLEDTLRMASPALLALAIVLFALAPAQRGSQTSLYLAIQLASVALFASMLWIPTLRDALALRRGETLPTRLAIERIDSLLIASPDAPTTMVLRAEAKAPALKFSSLLRVIAAVSIVIGIGGIVGGVALLMGNSTVGVYLVLAGVFALPPALVMLALANDWFYLGSTTGHEKAHLANIAADTQALLVCGAVEAALLLVMIAVDAGMR